MRVGTVVCVAVIDAVDVTENENATGRLTQKEKHTASKLGLRRVPRTNTAPTTQRVRTQFKKLVRLFLNGLSYLTDSRGDLSSLLCWRKRVVLLYTVNNHT